MKAGTGLAPVSALIANQEGILAPGAARKAELASVGRPFEIENPVASEGCERTGRAFERLQPDIRDAAPIVDVGDCPCIRSPPQAAPDVRRERQRKDLDRCSARN